MRYIKSDIAVRNYDLKGIIEFLKNVKKDGKTDTVLSIIQKLPEKILVSIVTSQITRKAFMPPLIAKINKKLSEEGYIMIDDVQLQNTGDRSIDIKLNIKFKDYASFLPLIMEKAKGKIKDPELNSILNNAVNVIFAEIPDDLKDKVINGIISGSAENICAFANNMLKKKDIPANLGNIDIEAGK